MNYKAQTEYRTKKEIRHFFEEQGVKYIKRSRITWSPLLSMKLDKSIYYRSNKEEFQALDRKYYADIENNFLAPIYLKRIDDHVGFGVFAEKSIKKNTFIGEYAGVVQASLEDSGRELSKGGYESDFSWYYLDEIKDSPCLEINGRLEGNEMRFVNHSHTPNLEVEHTLHKGQWVLFFKAKKDIKTDEQLLISYGDEYWSESCRELLDV